MMWIVRLALRRPYTFVVFALLILILGAYSIDSMPTDIFPNIDIPVVTVVWQFTGLSAEQMANRIVFNSERGMTTTVNDIEHIESQSLNGIAVIKIFFQPHVNIASAVAQVTAISQVQLRSLPPGTTPPFIIQYNASSVPILQLGLSGRGPQRAAAQRPRPPTRSAPSWPPLKARKRPIPTAASSARFRWISTCTRCRPRAFRQPTSSTPSTRKI